MIRHVLVGVLLGLTILCGGLGSLLLYSSMVSETAAPDMVIPGAVMLLASFVLLSFALFVIDSKDF